MKYQLIIQWQASSIKDYDAMIEIEDILVDKLSKKHVVDGHDAGSGEVNIFILTDNPEAAFNEVKAILSNNDFWIDAKVAYRKISEDGFTILWPKELQDFSVK